MFDCKSVAKLRRKSYMVCLNSQNFSNLKVVEKFINLK